MYNASLISSMVLAVLILWSHTLAGEGGSHGPRTRMEVSGVVSKVQSGVITVKTSWGEMRISSALGLDNVHVGEDVKMSVNENNIVIDVHRKGEPQHHHRYMTGNVVSASADKNEITLLMPEGEKTFSVQRNRSKLSVLEEGAPVTVEVNDAGSVVDLHRATVEMDFAKRPKTEPGHNISANGEVTRIQSGVIFVKTPVGQYTISANSAPSDAKVGDKVTLWLNQENMVVDHHRQGTSAAPHRLISGKLIYAGLTKKEIKLWTPEGEKVFPLERMEVKTKPIEEGSLITVELNENGTVVDLWKAES